MQLTEFIVLAFAASTSARYTAHPKEAAAVVRTLSNSTTSTSQESVAGSDSSSGSDSSGTGGSYTASFTQYTNCKTPALACGYYNDGYTAAVSQALFGVGPGAGPGPACGTCWKLSSTTSGTNSIVVKVNNLCPDDGNPLCAQALDTDVNFDLCADTGTGSALFGSSGTEQVNGTAVSVDCSEWTGGPNIS
ncbi:hypothetical protein MMC28_009370 [Mycoblastus sanguinarius]|nr:hypothetical protein [Mycoblastus sanguinarius]